MITILKLFWWIRFGAHTIEYKPYPYNYNSSYRTSLLLAGTVLTTVVGYVTVTLRAASGVLTAPVRPILPVSSNKKYAGTTVYPVPYATVGSYLYCLKYPVMGLCQECRSGNRCGG